MNIIKAALKTITPKFPTEFTTFEKDITVKENEIIVDESCSLWQAIGRVDVLAKEVATKLADEAKYFGTDEYKLLQDARKDYPTFSVATRKTVSKKMKRSAHKIK